MAGNPIDDSTGQTVFIGSHLKANVGYGTGGDPNASSLLPGQQPKRSPEGKALIKGMDAVSATPWAGQTRPVSAAPMATKPGMRNPNASPAKVPTSLNRGDGARPSVRPARPGNFKR